MIHASRSARSRVLGAVSLLALVVGCGGTDAKPAPERGPFASLEVVAASTETRGAFVHPLAAVPLDDSRTVMLAFRPSDDDGALTPALFMVDGGAPSVLHEGDLVQPVDVAFDGQNILVADAGAAEGGGIRSFGQDGTAGELLAAGYAPVSLAVDGDGNVLFSGRDAESGDPGVFRLKAGGGVKPLYVGAPLVDPSGIALLADGRVLVADTSYDSDRSAVLLLDDGKLSLFAAGIRTGFPAGIALTAAEDALLVSAEDDAHHDVVNVIGIAHQDGALVARGGEQVSSVFSDVSDSSGGLHPELGNPKHLTWCSTSKNDGTVYRVETF